MAINRALRLDWNVMLPEVVSTHGLPATQQMDVWRSWFDSVYDVDLPTADAQGFLAESRQWALGDIGIGWVTAPGLRVVRSKTLLRSNPVDHWVIAIGQRETEVQAPNTSLLVPAQTPFLISLGERVTSERAADDRLNLYLPRDGFADIATQLDAARNTMLGTGLGKLLGDFLRNLARELPRLTPEDLPRVQAAVRAMVGACVMPTADRMVLASDQIDKTRLGKIRQVVRRNIESPQLDTAMLCGALGVSRTQLYRLMQGQGGVERYIRRLRLEACRERLASASQTGTIAEIVAKLGFDDASQFSRAFRREFGVSPSDVRALALAESGTAPRQARRPGRPSLRGMLAASGDPP